MRASAWAKQLGVGALTVGVSAAMMSGPMISHAAAKPPKSLTITITATVPESGGGATPIASGGSTNQSAITFTFSSSVPGATLTCSHDATKAAACKSPVTLTGLKSGSHTFRVQASATGYHRGNASFSWTVDATPPPAVTFAGVPTHPVAVSPSITFTGESGDKFTCSVDGGAPAICTPGSTGTSSVTGEGTHTLTVVPTDAAGNVGPSNSVSWTLDTTAPTVVINSAPASTTNSTGADVEYTVNDPTAIVTCKLNGSTVSCSSSSWSGTGLTNNTTYMLVVTATDPAGNHSTATAQWKVDSTVPTPPTYSAMPSGITNQTSGAFSFSTGNPSDTYQCALDPANPAAIAWTGNCSSGAATSDTGVLNHVATLTDGPHKFFVRAINAALNTSAPTQFSWVVDTTPPTLTVTGLPSGPTKLVSAAPVITVTDANPLAPICALAGPTPSGTCGPYSNLADGDYTLTVNDSDAAGNPATPVVAHWQVDSTPPVAAITAPTSLTGPARVNFGRSVTGSVPALVQFGVAGGAAVPTTTVCHSATAVVPCTGSYVSISITPKSALMPGQHYLVSVAGGIATDDVDNTAAAASLAFRGQRTLAATNAAAHYQWATVASSSAIGHSYQTEHILGASATWKFSGPTLTWWTRTGPTQGLAAVKVDGHRVATVNNYAKTVHAKVGRSYRKLGKGAHSVTVLVLGRKGAKHAKGTAVAVDAFSVGHKRTNTPKLNSAWGTYKAGVRADLAKAQVTVTFRGTGFTWVSRVGRAMGIAKVYVDGKLKATVDNYATAAKSVKRTLTKLTDAKHTVKIVVAGKHHRGGTGNSIVISSYKVA
jgi:hypothetical protein